MDDDDNWDLDIDDIKNELKNLSEEALGCAKGAKVQYLSNLDDEEIAKLWNKNKTELAVNLGEDIIKEFDQISVDIITEAEKGREASAQNLKEEKEPQTQNPQSSKSERTTPKKETKNTKAGVSIGDALSARFDAMQGVRQESKEEKEARERAEIEKRQKETRERMGIKEPGKLGAKKGDAVSAMLNARLGNTGPSDKHKPSENERAGDETMKKGAAALESLFASRAAGSAVNPEDIQRMSEGQGTTAPSTGAPPPPPPPMPSQSAAPTPPPPPPPMPGESQGNIPPPPGPAPMPGQSFTPITPPASPTPESGQGRANLMDEIKRTGKNTRDELDKSASQGVASEEVPKAEEQSAAPKAPPPPPGPAPDLTSGAKAPTPPPMPGKVESNIPPAPPMPESFMPTPPASPTPENAKDHIIPAEPTQPQVKDQTSRSITEANSVTEAEPAKPATPSKTQEVQIDPATSPSIPKDKDKPIVGKHTKKLMSARSTLSQDIEVKPEDAKKAISEALGKIKKGPVVFKEKYTLTKNRDGYADKLFSAFKEAGMSANDMVSAMKDSKVRAEIAKVSKVSAKKIGTGLTISVKNAHKVASTIKQITDQKKSHTQTVSK